MAEQWRAKGPDDFGDFAISAEGEELAKCVVVQNGFRTPAETKQISERLIVAVNNHDALVKALTELSNMYTHAWDRVDGGLTMFGSSVDRFEKAHRDAHVLLCTIKGEPLPVDLDEDDTDLVSGPGSGE